MTRHTGLLYSFSAHVLQACRKIGIYASNKKGGKREWWDVPCQPASGQGVEEGSEAQGLEGQPGLYEVQPQKREEFGVWFRDQMWAQVLARTSQCGVIDGSKGHSEQRGLLVVLSQGSVLCKPGLRHWNSGGRERKERLLYIHISGIFLVLCF